MSYDLPAWTQLLRNYYVSIRLARRGSTLQRSYYLKVQAEKLRLAEQGICQQKIRAACRFMASHACMRDYNSNLKDCLISLLIEPDNQLLLPL